jgi:hypothetical protein
LVVRLPYRNALLDYLRETRADGRRIVLATAAHRSIALAVASHLGCFDDVLATDGHNLKGRATLEAIVARVGVEFSYGGIAPRTSRFGKPRAARSSWVRHREWLPGFGG